VVEARLHADPRKSPGARSAKLGEYTVRSSIDSFSARRAVRGHASAIGFPRIEAEELALASSELCSNIVKYGVSGVLVVERLEHLVHGVGLVLDAQDSGPPFRDFDMAVRDGSDDRGTIPPEALYARRGIGAGLGSVQRFTHLLFVEQRAQGKSVLAVRYLKKPSASS
jgi:anti-sigma regulatory factor (Ser/Thr protein kinase)